MSMTLVKHSDTARAIDHARGGGPATTAAGSDAVGLRERQKDATRRALAEQGLHLALTRGYRNFTIAELVAAVGVSRRTFSNYFASKAECVAAVAEGWLDDVIAALHSAPRDAALPDVMRQILVTVVRDGAHRWGALQPLIDDEPELAAQVYSYDATVSDLLVIEAAERFGMDADDMRLRIFARAAIMAGHEAFRTWADIRAKTRAQQRITAAGEDPIPISTSDEETLAALLDQAFSVLNPAGLATPAAAINH